MTSDISTILFDLDGTIANTNEVILKTIGETLEHFSGRPWRQEELLTHWGMILRHQLVQLYPEIDLERAVPFYRARYATYHEALLMEFPGVRALLAELQARGYRLGVVTSKKRYSAEETISGLGYGPFFEIVVVEEDTARHKPAPDPLCYAAAQLGIAPCRAIYVGDNPDDIRAAHAAGMIAVGVGWCLRPRADLLSVAPDLIIDEPEELFCLLGQTVQQAGI